MRNKHMLFPLVMGTLAFVCFLAITLFMSSSVQPLWGRMMALLLPALVLYIVAFASWKGKINAGKTVLLTSVLTVVLLLLSVFYVFLLSIWTATTVTTDVRYYSRAFSEIANEEGVNGVFMNEIPDDAKEVVFRYNPQFLQGGEVFALSYTTSDEKIAEWENKLEQKASWIGSNEEWCRLNNWSSHDEDATRYQLYWDGGSNHGEMSYVLVEPSINRITFCYTDW